MSDHAKYSPRRFHPQAEAALADPVLRQNFRGAMDYLRAKRRDAFADPQEEAAVRDAAEQIRQRCSRVCRTCWSSSKPTASATASVHWAQTPAEANAIILGIAQKRGEQHRQGQVHGERGGRLQPRDGAPRHPLP